MSAYSAAVALDKFSTFGDLLRYLRRRMGLTQRELSLAVGYSDAQISRLEQNQRLPDPPTIAARFVSALGIEDESAVVARLMELAATARREDAPAAGLPPFKGLLYFDESDADIFFGRETLTTKLHARLTALLTAPQTPRLLAIVGASGSGKSSVIRAGLVPALRWNPDSANWPILVFTPAAHPLESLAAGLIPEAKSLAVRAAFVDGLARDPHHLHLVARQAARSTGASHVCLVVDQFEELFTLCRSDAERKAFVDNLLTAACEPDGATVVVIALRADFYAPCADFPDLRQALASQQEYIGALNAGELRRAMEEPARRGGWELEPGLADLLLHDLNASENRQPEPGALPLLSHALLETWQRRRGRMLTLSGYFASGGVRGAIAETAEAVFHDQLDAQQQAIARNIFLRLTELGDTEAVADTRRRVSFDELVPRPGDAPAIHTVLTALADARLVTTEQDSVEVAHEALLREWPRLREWLRESRADVRLQRQLAQAAQEWQNSNRDVSFLLTGARLTQFEGWLTSTSLALTSDERAFYEASIAERERRLKEEQARKAREAALEKRARQVLLALVGVFLVAAVVAGGLAFRASQAEQAARLNLRSSEAQRLAAEANRLFIENRDYETAALLALRSLSLQYTPQGDEALSRASRLEYPARELAGHAGEVRPMAFSADGKLMVSGDGSGTPILWDVATGEILQQFKGHTALTFVTISPDGRLVASGSDDGTLRIWDAATGQEIYKRDYGASVWALAVTADSRSLLIGGWDKTVRLLDFATGEEIKQFANSGAVLGTAISPDGSLALTGGDDGIVRLWDVQTGREKLSFSVPVPGWPWGFAFSPDLSTFAIAQWDKVAYIYDTQTGKEIHRLVHTDELFTFTAYSPDGRYVLTGDTRGIAHLWDVQTGLEARQFLHGTSVSGGAFTPGGQYVVTGAYDRLIRFWSLGTKAIQPEITGAGTTEGKIAFTLDGQTVLSQGRLFDIYTGEQRGDLDYPSFSGISADGKTAYALAGNRVSIFDALTWTKRQTITTTCTQTPYGIGISPDGSRVAVGSFDKPYRICLLDALTGQELRTIDVPISAWGLAFSPDGQLLAAGACDTTTHLYDVTTGADLRALKFPGTVHCINDVAFSPDGHYILSAGTGDKLWLWDVQTGEKVREFIGHTGVVWGVAFSRDGRYAVSGGADGTARLWDVATGKELRRFAGHTATIWEVAFSPDGSLVATTSSDGSVKFWKTDLEELKTAMCATLIRNLSDAERARYGITDTSPTCP